MLKVTMVAEAPFAREKEKQEVIDAFRACYGARDVIPNASLTLFGNTYAIRFGGDMLMVEESSLRFGLITAAK